MGRFLRLSEKKTEAGKRKSEDGMENKEKERGAKKELITVSQYF